MNFEDTITVRLADASARSGIFTQVALRQIATALYDAESLSLDEEMSAVFDSLEMGLALPRAATIDGGWQALGGSERRDVRLTLSGLGAQSEIRVNALWRGRIVMRTKPANSRITAVTASRIEPGAEAVASGAARTVHATSLVATFADPADDAPATPVPLPVTAALLARDADVSLTTLLIESKTVREQLQELGLGPPRDARLARRFEVLPVWIVPATLFDDDAWPGGNDGMTPAARQEARRAMAGEWLAREGIGLVAVSV